MDIDKDKEFKRFMYIFIIMIAVFMLYSVIMDTLIYNHLKLTNEVFKETKTLSENTNTVQTQMLLDIALMKADIKMIMNDDY